MKIVVDHERCIGSGMCALTAPTVFDQNDKDGRVVLLSEQPGPESIEAARQAVASCPSGALSIRDDPHERSG